MASKTAEETVNDVVVEDQPGTDIIAADDETANARGGFDVGAVLESMNDPSKIVTTISGDDFDARLALAEALTSSTPIEDQLNKPFLLADYVITEASFTDKETGEVVTAPRIVLIDSDGNGYHGTSVGMLTSLRNFKIAMGDKWGESPLPVVVKREKGNNGWNYFSIKVSR